MKAIYQSFTLAVIGLFLLAESSHATTRNWTGAGLNSLWTTATNWDTYPTIPAVNGDTLVFAGTNRLTMTNDYAAITNTMTFNSGGWTLNGNPVWLGGTLTSSTGTNVINVNTPLTAARTVTVSLDQLTMNGVMSGAFGLTKGGVGTLILTTNNTYTGGTTIAASTGIVKISNTNALGTGAVTISKNGVVFNGYLQLALTGVNTITNTFAGFSATTTLGDPTVPCIENLSGTNTLTSAMIVTTTGGNGETFKSSGGLLILGGTLGSIQASRGVEFNGFGNGLVNGAITNGLAGAGFTIWKDGSGTWTLNGTNSTVGNLIIQNGKIALGANGSISNVASINIASSGSLDVSAVPGGWTLNAGKFLVGNGVVFGNVTIPAATIQPGQIPALYSSSVNQTAGTLTFSNNLSLNGSTITMNLSSDPTGVSKPNDLVVVGGNLTASGVNTISLNANPGSVIANGTYPIIKFTGAFTGNSNNFTVANFPTGGRGTVSGYILTNTGVVNLVVTGTPPANIVWRGDGSGNNWDVITTSNWQNGANLDLFYNNDAVVFDDTATNYTVNLPANVTPGFVAVNSTNSYSLNGAGSIGGANGLIKSGSGTLTINNVNSYTGSTTINGGTLAVSALSAPAAASPVGASANSIVNLFLNGGTLEITGGGETTARDFSVGPNGGTLQIDTPGAVENFSTSGGLNASVYTFTKTGPGTLTSGFQQVFEGTNNIFGGILKIPTVGWFGVNLTTPVFINGGVLDINGVTMSTKPVVVQGMGDAVLNANSGTTNGAIINSSATGQNQAFQFVTLTGDTAFGGTGRWDIRANSTASLYTGGNAYNLYKVGANQISLVGATIDPALANIDVRSGTLSYETGTTGLGNPANTLTVEASANFQMVNAANALNKQFVLADNSTVIAASGVNTISGPVNLLGDTAGGTTFNVGSGVSLSLNGVVSGAGNLNKIGAGTLTLTTTNNYSGTTTVTAGKLVVNSGQTGAAIITENDGTTLGVTISGSSQLKTDTLNLGSGVGPVTNEFTTVASTTTAPIVATNLVVNGPTTINILSGSFLAGQIYPLINFSSISGSGNFVLGALPPLVTAAVITNGSSIALSVSSAVAIEFWTGIVNGNWDINTTTNWNFNNAPAKYANGNTVQFDDTASNTTVNVTTTVGPKGIFVNNPTKNYSFSGSPISGTNSVTKQGAGALTFNSANTYSGGTFLSAGTLNINDNAALGATNSKLVITGGSIDNTGSGAVTMTNNNAQNWNGDFTFIGNQNLNIGTGTVTLGTSPTVRVNGSILNLDGGIVDGGAGYALTKAGVGSLTLRGTNTYTGLTTVLGGSLDIYGNQSAAIGGYLIGPSNVNASVVNFHSASTVVVAETNAITIGNNVLSGTASEDLNVLSTVLNNGTLFCGRAGSININTNGNWTQRGSMTINAIGGFAGTLTIATGGAFVYTGPDNVKVNPGNANTGNGTVAINGGTFTTSQAFEQTLTGSTGVGLLQLTKGGSIVLSSNVPQLIVVNTATLIMTNGSGGGAIDTAGFATEISVDITGPGSLTKRGAGSLTLSAPAPLTYLGNTVINGGILALSNFATLSSSNIIIAGGATFDVAGLATPALALVGQAISNSTSTAFINGSVDATAGVVSLAYTSGTPGINVKNGALTLADATPVIVNNVGAVLGNGSYKLISQGTGGSVSGTAPTNVVVTGAGMGAGGSAALNITANELYLNVSGAVTVNTNTFTIGSSVSGNNLNLTWPPDRLGWRLQVQTNSLNIGLGATWFTWPNSTTVTNVSIPLNPGNSSVFLRMVYP